MSADSNQQEPNLEVIEGVQRKDDNAKEKKNYKDNRAFVPPQTAFENIIKHYFNKNPYTPADIIPEVEARFGTKGIKYLTKIDYDNVIRKLKSMGFESDNEQGEYLLRIKNDYLDTNTGRTKESNIRTEIVGIASIQEYCKSNSIKKLNEGGKYANAVNFVRKTSDFDPTTKERIDKANFDDFNFRVSYSSEETISRTNPIIYKMLEGWDRLKKTFRYLNRVTFQHQDYPIKVDISIVRSSLREGYQFKRAYNTQEAGVFENPESYEIELEMDNTAIGPGTRFRTPVLILNAMRKVIKFVLAGLQGTNYPISYKEQDIILKNYMDLILHDDPSYDPKKRIKSTNFLGPQSYTLEMKNIVHNSEDTNVPNIRKDYVVTEKADGERTLMYIASDGKIYLINTNMNVMFTGAVTREKKVMNSILDGELVLHDKYGRFINKYLAFDIYYINRDDCRQLGFLSIHPDKGNTKEKFRYPLLTTFVKMIDPVSVVSEDEQSPIMIEYKTFYPNSVTQDQNIFSACGYILKKAQDGLFEYETDGLILTPALMGVGADRIGVAGPKKKITWDYSFKWKPAEFNTIDFLVTTKKNANGLDIVTPIFEAGMNLAQNTDLSQYKTLSLKCGYSEKNHGYLNPCQDVIEDKLPSFNNKDDEDSYVPVQFYPTKPYDPNAGITKIMLIQDANGDLKMKTEEGEVFEDETIVECRYDLSREGQWRWVPLRVRYDKTADFRQGLRNFGNAYNVADSNWRSIHNPITPEMISTGLGVPETINDEDVYYNRVLNTKKTESLRDFHNLYVKKKLIKGVAKRDDTLIDFACGPGGDFPKWNESKLSFVFGIDISKDNLENKINGACARFLNFRKQYKHVPYALFVNGNSMQNIRSGAAMLNDKAVQITKAVFGDGTKDAEKLGKGVARQYGKGAEGFNISSCQFAIHYFMENVETLQNFMINVAECTALNGYFIGTSYDGKEVFKMLRKKDKGDSRIIMDGEVKIWELIKQYSRESFEDDSSCLGYKIDVFQESINKVFSEYLVNYDYLNRVLMNYGFRLATREEARSMGLPEGSGLFSELFMDMIEEVKRNPKMADDYRTALKMNAIEKEISFLNRYFVYKKIAMVDAKKVVLEELEAESDKEEVEEAEEATKTKASKTKASKTKASKTKVKEPKVKVKKLNKKLMLVAATDAVDVVDVVDAVVTEVIVEPKKKTLSKLKSKKKIQLIMDDDSDSEEK